MKKSIVAGAVLLALTAATGALAKDMNGTIKKVDAATSSITLDDGKVLKLPVSVDASTLKVGEKVQITYMTASGKTTVESIKPAK